MGHGGGGGGDGGPAGQAIIGQTWPVVQGGGQGGGQGTTVVLVGVLLALTVQVGGQTIVAVLLVPLVSGQGGGHVGVVPVCAQGGGHGGAAPVAVPAEQGGGQTSCG